MKKTDLVVQSNALVQASYSLTLSEQRLIRLAIVGARETQTGITTGDHLHLDAKTYAEQFDLTLDAAYLALKHAAATLFERQVTFYDIDPELKKRRKRITRWVSEIAYIDDAARVQLIFAPAVVEQISRQGIEFIRYTLEQIAGIGSTYAIRLYELLIQWMDVGITPILKLGDFREQLGVSTNEYHQMGHFKARVLDLAVKQVSKHSNITVTYEQIKSGRTIVGFVFKVKQKGTATKTVAKEPSAKPPRNISALAGFELVLFKEITVNHPEITEKYVREYAEQSGVDLLQALQKIKADYKAAEEFSLEKTN
jgi:plasmid replication initiation protein